MNCPSRTDDTWLHDDWNQNPPRFAPDLTTCQDLNGISNARENRVEEKGSHLLGSGSNCAYEPSLGRPDPSDRLLPLGEASLTKSGMGGILPSLLLIDSFTDAFSIGRLPSGKDSISLSSQKAFPNNNNFITSQRIKDWGLWLLSVICMAALLSRVGGKKHHVSIQPIVIEDSPVERSFVEPEKRSRCASGGVGGDTYDMPLHVAALFIIFFVSGFGCAFPILATRFPRLHVPASFLFFVSHFGTGVLIATAFVHLLPTAFTSLGDPCLSDFWTKDYPAMPGAIALGGIFLVTVIEMVFSPARHVCRGGNRGSAPDSDAIHSGQKESPPDTANDSVYLNNPRSPVSRPVGLDAGSHLRDMGPLVGRSASISRAINRMGEGNEEIVRVASAPDIRTHHEKDMGAIQADLEREDDSFELSPEQKQKKETMQVYLLEMGILFHSVFIGMSLSVSVGKEFVVLLIAIVFHREFSIIFPRL